MNTSVATSAIMPTAMPTPTPICPPCERLVCTVAEAAGEEANDAVGALLIAMLVEEVLTAVRMPAGVAYLASWLGGGTTKAPAVGS